MKRWKTTPPKQTKRKCLTMTIWPKMKKKRAITKKAKHARTPLPTTRAETPMQNVQGKAKHRKASTITQRQSLILILVHQLMMKQKTMLPSTRTILLNTKAKWLRTRASDTETHPRMRQNETPMSRPLMPTAAAAQTHPRPKSWYMQGVRSFKGLQTRLNRQRQQGSWWKNWWKKTPKREQHTSR